MPERDDYYDDELDASDEYHFPDTEGMDYMTPEQWKATEERKIEMAEERWRNQRRRSISCWKHPNTQMILGTMERTTDYVDGEPVEVHSFPFARCPSCDREAMTCR